MQELGRGEIINGNGYRENTNGHHVGGEPDINGHQAIEEQEVDLQPAGDDQQYENVSFIETAESRCSSSVSVTDSEEKVSEAD